MDRSVAHAAPTDALRELWPLAFGILTLVALVWTGALESIVSGNADLFHPRRLAIALCVAAALGIVAAWRHLGSRS